MVAGRWIALTAVGIASLLAVADVRPASPESRAAGLLNAEAAQRARDGIAEGHGAPGRDTLGVRAGTPAPAAAPEVVTAGEGVARRRTTGAPAGPAAVERTSSFPRAAASRDTARRREPDDAAALAAMGGREPARGGNWVWGPASAEAGASSARAVRDGTAVAGVTRGHVATSEAAGPSIRVTQTFDYVHGSSGAASTALGDGIELPTGPEIEIDVGTDAETEVPPTDRRSATHPGSARRGGAHSPSGRPPQRAAERR